MLRCPCPVLACWQHAGYRSNSPCPLKALSQNCEGRRCILQYPSAASTLTSLKCLVDPRFNVRRPPGIHETMPGVGDSNYHVCTCGSEE